MLEVVDGERVVFTCGYASGQPIAPDSSRVTVTLSDVAQGTLLELRHAFGDAAVRDQHVGGWRYQLAVSANVVAAEQRAGLARLADRHLAAWAETEPAARRAALAEAVSDHVEFRDALGCTSGRDELDAHIAAAQVHMPGARMTRAGEPRQCQGMAMVDGVAAAADGSPAGAGTNVVRLAPDGRIARVVGFWAAAQ